MRRAADPRVCAARARACQSDPWTGARRLSRTAIVTDGAAAIPTELAALSSIRVVPMWLSVQGVPEPEGARPLDELMQVRDVRTSAPSPGEFGAAVAACLADADEVVVLTVAASMSATHEAARAGSARFGDAVTVVDTGSAAGGQALVVLAAARAAAAGGDGSAVAGVAADVAARVRLVATVPDLDHLVRSGRVSGVAGWAGNRLGINPLFEFRCGVVRRLRPALSADAARERMVALIRRSATPGARLHVAVLHALAGPAADALMERVSVELAPVESFLGGFGSVMVVHTGPGLAGLAWWWEERAPTER